MQRGASARTIEIADFVQNKVGMTALAHLTSVLTSDDTIAGICRELQAKGIKNILGLRGDFPDGYDPQTPRDFQYASDLIARIMNWVISALEQLAIRKVTLRVLISRRSSSISD